MGWKKINRERKEVSEERKGTKRRMRRRRKMKKETGDKLI